MSDGAVEITPELAIPLAELSFRASRAGGPGGQHVNTSSTRVELVWDVEASTALSPEQRARIRSRLRGRISGEGLLSLASATTRSQRRNREEVTERFVALLREALHRPKPRKATRPTRASREKRIQSKKQRSEIKQLRRSVPRD